MRTITAVLSNESPISEHDLIVNNLGLVKYMVAKFEAQAPLYKLDRDDLVSIGNIGLIKAAKRFNPNRGIRFATFAVRCIQNEILLSFRNTKKLRQDTSLCTVVRWDDRNDNIELMDVIPDDMPPVEHELEQQETRDAMFAAINRLRPKEQAIIKRRFGLVGEGITQKELAFEMGYSRSWLSRVERKTIKRLRNIMGRR